MYTPEDEGPIMGLGLIKQKSNKIVNHPSLRLKGLAHLEKILYLWGLFTGVVHVRDFPLIEFNINICDN